VAGRPALGTSEQVIQRTYGHHCIEDLREAVGVWSTAKTPPETREQNASNAIEFDKKR
jgi:hypothetical protein